MFCILLSTLPLLHQPGSVCSVLSNNGVCDEAPVSFWCCVCGVSSNQSLVVCQRWSVGSVLAASAARTMCCSHNPCSPSVVLQHTSRNTAKPGQKSGCSHIVGHIYFSSTDDDVASRICEFHSPKSVLLTFTVVPPARPPWCAKEGSPKHESTEFLP